MGTRGEWTPGHDVIRDSNDLSEALGGAVGRTGIVAVVDGDADTWLRSHRRLAENAQGIAVVSLGEQVRSTTTASGPTNPLPDVRGVANAGDLANLGRHVTETIADFEAQGLTPVVVVDAVEALIDATSLEATFRVVHLLSARTRRADGRVVTVLPETLPREAIDTLGALAD